MIKEEEVFRIGHITKSRGICGEVEMNFTDDVFDRGEAEYLVLKLDGILVPFFWEEYRFKNDNVVIIKFEDMECEADSQRIVGAEVFYPEAYAVENTDGPSSWKYFTGFTIYDSVHGKLGVVDSVDDTSANILFYIRTDEGEELIIPFHPELLADSDDKNRSLTVNLPEGLLSIND